MLIKFLCPNGHPLSTSSDRAGKPGQCPKCGVKFLVPDAEDEDVEQSGSDARKNPPAKNNDVIVFLCPNGHRLNGPANLQGKAGQCPHCGAKFHIPVYDDEGDEADGLDDVIDVEDVEEIEEIEQLSDEASMYPPGAAPAGLAGRGAAPPNGGAAPTAAGHAAAGRGTAAAPAQSPHGGAASGSDTGLDFLASLEAQETGSGSGSSIPVGVPAPSGSGLQTPQGVADGHPMAEVFLRYWRQRGPTGAVELHLRDGKVVTPKQFSPHLSQPQFGVFALDDRNGTHTLATIAWDAVAQIYLRGVQRLPDGMFE